ncbi:GNAT family N-acetyltransferase [Streptacidiphilus jiangxiensis]|uniref:Acetyltransferase (GNAT) family protein n=1 Tax=Streptacidiphilus jiangxiensis TaxID=235985 RepID=A0A1H7NZN3_STRJI|nr:GNAT family N-acetyltransferase [Streptacidiphilus jiangxiensis]SEL28789.1 Acetyltransferase (GNAT) family protein [Streptacidiphilus jiangxiensis]
MLVKLVPVAEVLDLRWHVLRPGRPRDTALTDVDLLPDTFHVAVYTDSGDLGACATFSTEPPPDDVSGGTFTAVEVRRLRKMASAPDLRGQGFGSAALRAGMDESAARGARLLWCSGRLAAAGFYRHHGFTAVGAQFTVPAIGEHYHFVRELG